MVLTKISEMLNQFSPANLKIANYILGNYSEIGFISVEDLSNHSGVSKASVVRFARIVGYSGFDELKKAIQSELRKKLSPYEKIAITDLDRRSLQKQLEELSRNEINNLRKTLDSLTPEEAIKWVEAIIEARHIYLAGFGATRFVISLLSYALATFQSKPLWMLTGSVSDFSPRVKHMESKDLLIIMTFPPYSKEVEYVVSVARKKGTKILLACDSPQCPVFPYAYSAVICESNSLLLNNSFVGPIALIQILSNFLLLREKKTGMKEMKEIWNVELEGYKYIAKEGGEEE